MAQPGHEAGQRPLPALVRRVRHQGQAKGRQVGVIVRCVDHQPGHLRRGAVDHMGDQRTAGHAYAGLARATQPPGAATGQDHAQNRLAFDHETRAAPFRLHSESMS